MSSMQSHVHAVLVIYLSSARPIHVVRIQDPATSTSQGVGNASVLVLIVCQSENSARLQNENWDIGSA